jgi:protein phosphatase
LAVEAAGHTDRGKVRRRNEDSFAVRNQLGLFVVADGVSGREHGDVASRTAVDRVTHYVAEAAGATPGDLHDPAPTLFEEAVRKANREIYREGLKQGEGRGMTTTFVGALVHGEELCLAHVGDSRAYRYRDGHLVQMTMDHSVGNELFTSRRPDDWRLLGVNLAALTRALGLHESVQVAVQEAEARAGDVLLLCSDGLSNMLPTAEIEDILARESDLELCAEALVSAANDAGGFDNTTVVLVRWREDRTSLSLA